MTKWYDKTDEDLTPEDKKEMWRDIRNEIKNMWLLMFMFQLIIGAWSLYRIYEEIADIGIGIIVSAWIIGSAIMSTILLPVALFVMLFAAGITFGIINWMDKRRGKTSL